MQSLRELLRQRRWHRRALLAEAEGAVDVERAVGAAEAEVEDALVRVEAVEQESREKATKETAELEVGGVRWRQQQQQTQNGVMLQPC